MFVASVVLSIATAVLVCVTGYYAFQTKRMAETMRESLEAQMRPFVVVQVKNRETNAQLLDVIVRNCGGGPAFDFRCTFDPDVPYEIRQENRMGYLSELSVFRDLPFLAAGDEIKFLLDTSVAYWNDPQKPKRFDAHVAFRDSAGRDYAHTIPVDLLHRGDVHFSPDKSLTHIWRELEEMRKVVERLSSYLEQQSSRGSDSP
jgi:hypothetical protein